MEKVMREFVDAQLRLNRLLDEVKIARKDVEIKRAAYMASYVSNNPPTKLPPAMKTKKEHKTREDSFDLNGLPRP